MKEKDTDIQRAMDLQEDKVTKLRKEVEDQKRKGKLMADLIQRNYHIMQDMARRLDMSELNAAKRSCMLTGLDLSQNKGERNKQIAAFIEDTMSLEVAIQDSYFIGEKVPKPTVIVFDNIKDKQNVWESKARLKDYTGFQKAKIIISEYLPQSANEKEET